MSTPTDLKTTAEKKAYARGWNDRGRVGASKAGQTLSQAKSAAARANGAKGGRPPKSKPGPRKGK